MGSCACKFSIFSVLFSVMLLNVSSSKNNNDRASLVSFMSGIVSDPKHALTNWNLIDVHVCNWSGVKCEPKSKRVIELDLSRYSLRGTISPALSNLSYLSVLDLSGNFFNGEIPVELGSLSRLTQLSLSSNLLEGNIPSELGLLRRLVYLDLGSNRLTGEIPMPLMCNCSLSLQYLDLSNNTLSGEIPLKSHCGIKELKFLLLWSNQLIGKVPQALSNSSKLEWLDLESNFLSGELPITIVNKMPNLEFLYLSYNNFSSHKKNTDLTPFFSSLVNNSNLQELELAGNHLGGELPSIIGDLSTKLVQIHLDDNRIFGQIPPEISNLINLTLLNLSSNLLNGSIPIELCRMPKLERLYLSNNSLSGNIPSAFGNVPHLGLLDLSRNNFSGIIPDSFSNLTQLRRLLLHDNQLSGTIPSSLGQCINLEILDLSRNRISGIIPGEVAGLSSLKIYLNLSSNLLHGSIPLELSKMDMVLAIDLSSNNLSGRIPPQLGSCIALEFLNLSSNSLNGTFPESLGKLPYLEGLDVSYNELSGTIPGSLQASSTLKELNVSYNNFQGNVTNKGAFSSLTIDSFLGNNNLCGSIKGMQSCKKRKAHRFIITVLLSLIITPIFCIFGYGLVLKSKFKEQLTFFSGKKMEDDEEKGRTEMRYPKISHQQLIEATNGFSQSSLVGAGRYGHVYKGILRDNTKIAVKLLNPKTADEICGSFKRECEILRKTRHRNLIRIITTCSKPDFKALVFPLMENGSLENHLYRSDGLSHGLNLVQLVNICSDVAEGIAYLHHYSPIRVVHCDLKPSNILLDQDLTALVTDFGISRLIKVVDEGCYYDDTASYSSTDGLLCGSLGYIAPEYGMGKMASREGDVYSYGVLILEIITGKRPTEILSQQGPSLHEYVKSHYPYNLKPIIEDAMLRFNATIVDNENNIWRDVIVEMIELGLMCTQYNPSTRPTMSDVALEVSRMKQYVSQPSTLFIEDSCPIKRSPL